MSDKTPKALPAAVAAPSRINLRELGTELRKVLYCLGGPEIWALYRDDTQVRYLDKFENEFVDSALAMLAEVQAAPQQPVGWDGAEEWEKLAWHLCAEENGEDACNDLLWEGGPIPEPWGDRWLKYEGEARRMIALVRTHVPTPQPEAQEPVAWQSRTRPTWGANTSPWSPWEPCTKGQAEDYWKTPLLHDWAYEARALYTAPQAAPVLQADAEDAAEAERVRLLKQNALSKLTKEEQEALGL